MEPDKLPNNVVVREDFLRNLKDRVPEVAGVMHDMDQMHAAASDVARRSFGVDPSSEEFRVGWWLGLSRIWDAIDDEFVLHPVLKHQLLSRIAVEIGVGEWPRLSEMKRG